MRKVSFIANYNMKVILFFAMIAFAIILDQAVKLYILSQESPLFKSPFIDIILVYNKGIAFSFLSALGTQLKWIILAMLFLMLFIVLKSEDLFNAHYLAFGIIIGSGFSNLIDRFLRNGVVDYIFWHYKFHFAVFNLADAMINLAIAWIIIGYIIKRK